MASLAGNTMMAMIATLLVGILLGYLGQRSRMCFIGGIRDYIIVRDTYLVKGLIAFGLTAWVAFPLVAMLVDRRVGEFGAMDVSALSLTVVGGFGVGFVSTLANGCPFRQHVLAAQGTKSSVAYLAGFFAGAVMFHAAIAPLMVRLLP